MTARPDRTVLVTTRFFDDAAAEWLREQGCTVVTSGLDPGELDTALTTDRLRALLAGARGWIVGVVPVPAELLAEFPDLRIIARRGVGYDNVDIEGAQRLERIVTIAPGGNEDSVADHALAMMLALAKRLRESHDLMLSGRWKTLPSTELFRKTVGLVGFGRIARAVARRLRGFEATILAHDPAAGRDAAETLGVTLVDLPTLLARSDYVSLHLPLTPGTANLIDTETLARMKPGAILINTARGGLVDEVALAAALRDGRLAGAGLDVFASEADESRRADAEALLALPNVIATAHAAGSSDEGLARTNLIAARCVVDVLDGGKPPPHCVVVDGTA